MSLLGGKKLKHTSSNDKLKTFEELKSGDTFYLFAKCKKEINIDECEFIEIGGEGELYGYVSFIRRNDPAKEKSRLLIKKGDEKKSFIISIPKVGGLAINKMEIYDYFNK